MGRARFVVMLGPAPGSRGGIASVIATLLEHGYAAGGHCRFIATQVDGAAWRKALRAAAALAQVVGLLAAGRVRLLHVHVASGASFWRKSLFIGAARLFRCPVLFHLHGGGFPDFVERRLSGWRRRLALELVGGAAAAFALTGETAAWLRTRGRIARVDQFPNPVALPAMPRWAPDDSILFLGQLMERKGAADLLRAFAQVHALRPQARLVLAGDGDRAALLALALSLRCAGAVALPGWVGAAERARLLAAARVFVLPSHQEQMPVSLLEAMAAGTPVVACGAGAVPAMLGHGRYGTIVAVQDIDGLAAAILRIVDDNVLAEALSLRGRARVRSEYLVDIVLERLQQRYRELAA